MRRVERRWERRRWERLCATVDGGEPGRWDGEQPVDNSIFGTNRFKSAISLASSSSSCSSSSSISSSCSCDGSGRFDMTGAFGISFESSISPRIPQTTAVSPRRTTALPEQCVREFVWRAGVRKLDWVRPFARREGVFGFAGERWARRYGAGVRAAKMSGGKDRGWTASAIVVVVVIVWLVCREGFAQLKTQGFPCILACLEGVGIQSRRAELLGDLSWSCGVIYRAL